MISDLYYVLWSSFDSFWTYFFMYLFDYTMTDFHFLWFGVCYIIRNVRRNRKNRKPALWDFTGILVRLILLMQSLFLPLLLIICIKVIYSGCHRWSWRERLAWRIRSSSKFDVVELRKRKWSIPYFTIFHVLGYGGTQIKVRRQKQLMHQLTTF